MFRTLLAFASLALFAPRAEASPGGCKAARTMADVGLVAAGVGTVGGALLIPAVATNDARLTQLGAGLTYLGVSGSIASGVALVPTAARCGRTGRGVVGGIGLTLAGAGGALAGMGGSALVTGALTDDRLLFVVGIPATAIGLGALTPGVVMNRVTRARFVVPVQDVVVLPQLGQTPGLVVSGRF